MPQVSQHAQGMPCWVDASVSTSIQRQSLIDFYGALFGWSFDVNTPETGFYSIARNNGKAVLGIGEQPGGQGRWVTYFSTTDIARTAERAKDNGGDVFFPPMQVMDVGWMALVMDPYGAVHGLWQPITFPGFEVMYEPNSLGWFDHVSEDTQGAATYYEHVLGNGIESDAQENMTILRRGDQWFASLTHEVSSNQPPQWTPVFVVDSLDRIKNRVRELGGTVVVEEMPVPGSAISIFQDPVLGNYMTVMGAGENSAA